MGICVGRRPGHCRSEPDHHVEIAPGRPICGVFARVALGGYDASGPLATQPAALADTLFTPHVIDQGSRRSAGWLGVAEVPTLVPAWAMPLNARSWVRRLHDVSGQAGTARLRLASG